MPVSLMTTYTLTPLPGMNYPIANSVGIAMRVAFNWFCIVRLVWAEPADAAEPAAASRDSRPRGRD